MFNVHVSCSTRYLDIELSTRRVISHLRVPMCYSLYILSFRFIAVSFRLVPVYSGTILVRPVLFRRHSASFRNIPVYSGIFRSVPFHSVPVFSKAHIFTK